MLRFVRSNWVGITTLQTVINLKSFNSISTWADCLNLIFTPSVLWLGNRHIMYYSIKCVYVFCRVPPGYVYQSPYLSAAAAAATPGVVSLPPAQLSHAAIAAAAAATSQFYEYQNAAAAAAAAAAVSSYPSQAYTNGFETYPYTTAAGTSRPPHHHPPPPPPPFRPPYWNWPLHSITLKSLATPNYLFIIIKILS